MQPAGQASQAHRLLACLVGPPRVRVAVWLRSARGGSERIKHGFMYPGGEKLRPSM